MLHVRLLGDLELELDGVPIDPPASRRARSLLGLLALDRRLHPRPHLAARFWPDVLDESARTSLRSALAALRRSLGPEADRYLVATRERAGLTDHVETDVAKFERLRDADRLVEAMELWRGDLLSGLDDDWVLVARDEWRQKVGAVLGELATRAQNAGDLRAALAHTRRIVALDPLSEEAQRALMSRLAATGDCAAALVAYNRSTRIGSAPNCGSPHRRPRERWPKNCAAQVPRRRRRPASPQSRWPRRPRRPER